MKITLTLLLFGVFILSCEGDAPTEGSQEAVSPFDGATGAWISMNMDDNNNLTVAVSQFTSIRQMTIELSYNPLYSINNFKNGDFTVVFDGTTHLNNSFIFNDVEGDGILFTIDFDFNGASIEGTTISIGQLDFRLSNNAPVYMTCQGNEMFTNDVTCIANGHQWTYSKNEIGAPDEFWYQSVCYIKEHPTNGEVLFGGEYQWTNGYCWPIQAPW